MTIQLKDDQVIVAQATAQGAGAIGMIRVSGQKAIQVVDLVAKLAGNKKLVEQESHTIHYGWIVDKSGMHVDQVLFLLMRAPKTFTGQDVVEITCHNNQLLIEQIIDQLILAGARLAESGEFTRRAVLHGKVDLLQAEAINELIHAQTSSAIKQSLQQLEGSFSSWIADIEKQLLAIIAYCEASFEFLDEEMSFEEQIRQRVEKIQNQIVDLLQTFDKREYITQGVRIALVGSVNAGKSSLFNTLIKRKRAIVTDIAGTTRDTIEAGMYQDGMYVTFVDTAGLRKTQDVVEKIGIDRSFQEVSGADIILLVFDATAKYGQEEINLYQSIVQKHKDKVIIVQNKIDAGAHKLPFLDDNFIAVSTVTLQNIDLLRNKIDSKVADLMNIGQTPCLLNKRQYTLLLSLQQDLQKINEMIEKRIDYELVAIQINDAMTRLSELTGKTVSEDALDAIFREFCVGK
ncbi:MAG: tRNA uridine-5-carboxymethylaminomethyl(34) synthesis GTPase MnmE [Candidatus Chromulinivorax sp.]